MMTEALPRHFVPRSCLRAGRIPAPFKLGLTLVSIAISACQKDIPTSVSRDALELTGKPTSGGPTVSSTAPNSAPRDTTLDVHVFGSGYDRGSRVDMALDGITTDKVRTNSTRYVTSKELVANITIAADAVTDLYDVIVTTSQGKRGIGIEMFEITFQMTDLGTLGGDKAMALGINESGQVVGVSMVSRHGEYEVFSWTREGGMERVGPGHIEDLGENGWIVGQNRSSQAGYWSKIGSSWTFEALPVPPGVTSSNAFGISPTGDVIVGGGLPPGSAFLWNRTNETWSVSLLPVPPSRSNCTAMRAASSSLIVGFCDGRGVVWENVGGTWVFDALDPLSGDPYSYPFRINAAGDVVGYSRGISDDSNRAVLWKRNATGWDAPSYLGSFGGMSQALGINGSGFIVGLSYEGQIGEPGSHAHAFLWRPGGMIDLGAPPNNDSAAYDINDRAQLVGVRADRAVLWEPL